MKKLEKEKVKHVKPGMSYKNQVKATYLDINSKLLSLGQQLFGSCQAKAKIIPGMLNLANNRMWSRNTKMQQAFGKAILQIGKEVSLQNIQIAKNLSPI
jgi:hypothetical protein